MKILRRKTKRRKMMKTKTWIKIALYTSYVVVLLTGVTLGYLYYFSQGQKCETNPFVYGIKEINSLNHETFTCTCRSDENFQKGFIFDESGINTERNNPIQ